MLEYLIDGNNVIHANREWAKMFSDNPENAKNFFIQKVVDHFKDTKNKVTIFFDGFKFVHSFTIVSNNVNVKYAKNKTADETIIITIEKSRNKKRIVVITNDLQLSNKARLYQCKLISSNEFINMISIKKEGANNKPEQLSKSEVEYWLRMFEEREKRNQ